MSTLFKDKEDARSDIAKSPEYISFRSNIPRQTFYISANGREYIWRVYDHGPKDVTSPLVFLPPASGTGEVWFRQILPLTAEGNRCIAVEYPTVDSVKEFAQVFEQLLQSLSVYQIHICGASLGAFLAQKFAEETSTSRRVASLILINGFTDTSVFTSLPPPLVLKMLPAFGLKRFILNHLPQDNLERDIAQSVDFFVERLDLIPRAELLSRLILNVRPCYVEPQNIAKQQIRMTVMDVNDPCAISNQVKNETYKFYPLARHAMLKDGGNFPYLSRAEEVNVFIKIHLMAFHGTRFSSNANHIGTANVDLDTGDEEFAGTSSSSWEEPHDMSQTPISAGPSSGRQSIVPPSVDDITVGPAEVKGSSNADGMLSAIGDDEL